MTDRPGPDGAIRVSVIIPTYNRLKFLPGCIESIVSQNVPPFEIIVVDDGSSDGTADYIRQYGLSTLRVLEQSNAGAGAARNLGASAATGEYLAFLDSDDLWFPWSLESIIEVLRSSDLPSLVFAKFIDFSLETDLSALTPEVPSFLVFDDFLASAGRGFFAGAGMMIIRREVFLRVGGFSVDRLNAEDHDLALRLSGERGFTQILGPIIVAHRMHDGNAMGSVSANLAGMERLVVRENGGYYPGGKLRRRERRIIIAGHLRSAILAAARSGFGVRAASLFFATLRWQVLAGKVSFAIGAPFVLLSGWVRNWLPSRRNNPHTE